MSELILVDPKEFSIEEAKAKTIESSFMPKIVEFDGYKKVYQTIIESEISKENCKQAADLGRKLVKVRTGIAEIHKTEKAYYLAAGRYVDALKNKLTEPVTQMEDKLEEISTYYENLEIERIERISSERKSKLIDFTENVPANLGLMDDETFENLLSGAKFKYDAIKKAEQEAELQRLESDRLDKLEYRRRLEIAPYAQFITTSNDLRNMIDSDYNNLIESLKIARTTYEAEQEKIRLDNERLQKERESEKVKHEAELAKAKKESEEKEKERLNELAKEKAKQSELEAKLQAQKDAELKLKREKELQEIEAKKEADKLAKAPIKKQLQSWVNSFSLPETNVNNETSDQIKEKFESFKKWSENLINSL